MARCVVVLADGLRPDAITPIDAPSLNALARDYTSARNAMTVRPSVTVAALASFATGVSPHSHGLVEPGLAFLPRLARLRPLAKELSKARIRTTVAAGSPASRSRTIAWALATCAGVDRLLLADGGARKVAETALPHLAGDGFTFIYLPDCDQAGHAAGWMSPKYANAVAEVDRAIGMITARMGDSLLIVLADHGGGGVLPTDHDRPHELNDRIPVIVSGPGVRERHVIERRVSLLDVPPTVLHWFGLPVPDSYEGEPLHDAFVQPAVAAVVA